VGKEQAPSPVAPESFQTQERFVTCLTPILTWSLEAALVLPTGRLDGSAANGFASPPSSPVIHPVLVANSDAISCTRGE